MLALCRLSWALRRGDSSAPGQPRHCEITALRVARSRFAGNNRAMPGPSQVRPPRKQRALVPREHGAYGQLLVPLGCALLLGLFSSSHAEPLASAVLLSA